jgi:hypothetical protein
MDLPFKLLVSVMLMMMATAILMPALHAYQQSEVEHRTEIVVSSIDSAARSAFHHPGSSRTVLVDVQPSGGVRLDRLSIGGDLLSAPGQAGIISWEHSSGMSGSHIVASTGGAIPLAGVDGKSLVLDGRPCLLVLESMRAPEGSWCHRYVEVRVA